MAGFEARWDEHVDFGTSRSHKKKGKAMKADKKKKSKGTKKSKPAKTEVEVAVDAVDEQEQPRAKRAKKTEVAVKTEVDAGKLLTMYKFLTNIFLTRTAYK